jgi:hypothetical protein
VWERDVGIKKAGRSIYRNQGVDDQQV